MSNDAALVCRQLNRSFGVAETKVTALKQLDIHIKQGGINGLIGPDGAGKTTLMRLATGLLLPDSGSISVLGIDVLKSPLQVQSVLGYMPQRFGLYEDLSVQENLDLYADLQGVDEIQRRDRYAELMHMTGLAPFVKRLAGRLSGGMKQKLGLACSLVRTPKLLLLDEPTAGVDPVSRRELWAIIHELVEKQNTTVLLSTAYLDEAERCDDILLMHEGQVLGQGSPAQFSAQLRGRSFRISCDGYRKRQLQRLMSEQADILDAIIDNEKVRVVTRSTQLPALASYSFETDALTVEPVEPVFEDAFIATLKERVSHHSQINMEAASASPRPVSSEVVIEVDQVQKRFAAFYAVKDVSFKVMRGEVFGLLGANGAGKSTTFRMLCGLLPATAGSLKVAGQDLRHAAANARARLGYMAQRFSLYANLTVMENLNFFASAYGLNKQQRKQRIDWAEQRFDLGEHRNDKSGDLPLGYKQRLALAAALLHEPDILFLDEPTSGVDPLARREFWQRINALAESGVTVLVTTHFMAEADYCDRLVVMADGSVLAQGAPAELKAMFKSETLPMPSMEDTFIGLIESRRPLQESA